MISSHSEEPVANFNIANLNKSAEEFLPDKKARPDFNLQAIDLQFAQIVAVYKVYHLLDSFKIKAWPIKNAKAKKLFMSLRGAVANFNIAETPIFLRFQYCLDESIS